MTHDQLEELARFHYSKNLGLPEKANLYLTGISALAVNFMNETNAREFKVSAELPHKQSGKKYKATIIVEELK